ncbi:MAG TPA: hypothetical protein DD979_14425, partial [Gammaproteobacteria bacterium]|nr:hypothetical protein [Gammaproteobacteria bacterium]
EGLKSKYQRAIQQKVERNWIKPPGISGNYGCDVKVRQIPSGDVIDVEVRGCRGGSDALRRSVEAAVRRASPLPSAPDPGVFEPEITIFFRPEG